VRDSSSSPYVTRHHLGGQQARYPRTELLITQPPDVPIPGGRGTARPIRKCSDERSRLVGRRASGRGSRHFRPCRRNVWASCHPLDDRSPRRRWPSANVPIRRTPHSASPRVVRHRSLRVARHPRGHVRRCQWLGRWPRDASVILPPQAANGEGGRRCAASRAGTPRRGRSPRSWLLAPTNERTGADPAHRTAALTRRAG
jgi:hypothetical protein